MLAVLPVGICVACAKSPAPNSPSSTSPESAASTSADPFSAAAAASATATRVDRYDVRLGMAPPPEYTPAGKSTFTVATYNVAWLTDAYDNPYVDTENDNDTTKTSPAKLKAVASIIKSLDADIIVLQEVESQAFTLKFAETHLPDSGYKYIAGADSPTWIQNVIVLSRFPLGVQYTYSNVHTPVEGFKDEDTGKPEAQAFTNNRMMAVDVLVDDDYAVTVFGVHLKAGPGEKNEAWRVGQIAFMRGQMQRFLAERPNANIVVAGDFNLAPDGMEFRRLVAPANGVPMLVDVAAKAADPALLTHPANDPGRRIDFILPNANMAKEYVAGSLKTAKPLPAAEMYAASDHLPVIATFESTDK